MKPDKPKATGTVEKITADITTAEDFLYSVWCKGDETIAPPIYRGCPKDGTKMAKDYNENVVARDKIKTFMNKATKDQRNLYAECCVRKPNTKRGKDSAMLSNWLWCDVDDGDFGNDEYCMNKDNWKAAGLPEPTIIVKSAPGRKWFFWQLKSPWMLTDKIEYTDFRHTLTGIALLLGGDRNQTHGGCMFRVPGSVNFNHEGSPVVSVVRNNSTAFDIEEGPFADALIKGNEYYASKDDENTERLVMPGVRPLNLEEVESLCKRFPRIRRHIHPDHKTRRIKKDGSRIERPTSSRVFGFCTASYLAGVPDDMRLSLLMSECVHPDITSHRKEHGPADRQEEFCWQQLWEGVKAAEKSAKDNGQKTATINSGNDKETEYADDMYFESVMRTVITPQATRSKGHTILTEKLLDEANIFPANFVEAPHGAFAHRVVYLGLKEFNDRFIFLRSMGGKSKVYCPPDSRSGKSRVEFFDATFDTQHFQQSFGDHQFRHWELDKDFRPKAKFGSLAKEWLKSPLRKTADYVVFEPPMRHLKVAKPGYNEDTKVFNAYQGLSHDVKPLPAGSSKQKYVDGWFNHVEECIAAGDKEVADYIVKWWAFLTQYPGELHRKALVVTGVQGSGKSILSAPFLTMFGPCAARTAKDKTYTGNFDGHLYAKLLFAWR